MDEVEDVLADATRSVVELSQDFYQQTIVEWNNTDKLYPDKTICQLIEEQTMRTPNILALVYEEETLTYQEVNAQANQLASLIRQNLPDLTPDTLIALNLERSPLMIIGILAILKAGAAYVPIDPTYPLERINYILEDCAASLLLSTRHLIEKLQTGVASALKMIALDEQGLHGANKQDVITHCQPHNLAYVLYTSGTTGMPKGVMISHANVTNYALNVLPYLADVERVDFSTNLAFDLSVTTTLVPLMAGKTLFIYRGLLHDMEHYIHHLQRWDIQFIKSTPSYLMQLFSFEQASLIKKCFVGGEKLERAHLARITKYVGQLYDEYGPTETTVGALLAERQAADKVLAMGKPYFNYKTYVLDKELKPVAAGSIGELYIAGAGLARGYLNQASLSAERFITNPFATSDWDSRLYKTGDLARWLSDGALEYLGRDDEQVKIRGMRVELGEIEHALLSHEQIDNAVVLLVHEQETKPLLGFYQSPHVLPPQDIQVFLLQKLPEYMVPSVLLQVPKIPLTNNGKIDRQALKQFMVSGGERHCELTPCQEFVANLLKKIMRLDVLPSMEDNFFALGGHSLLITAIIIEIRKAYACQLKPKEIYATKNLAELAALIELKCTLNESIQEPLLSRYPDEAQQFVLSSYQLGIYLEHNRSDAAARAYTTPVFVQVDGQFDTQRATKTFFLLAKRHKILTGFIKEQEGQVIHYLNDSIHVSIEETNLSDLSSYLQTKAEKIIKLEHSLIDFAVIDVMDKENLKLLSFTHHHLVADGYAIELMIRDYFELYEEVNDKEARAYNYYSYVSELQSASSAAYWLQNPLLNTRFTIPGIAPRSALRSFSGQYQQFDFAPAMQQQIQQLSIHHQCSVNIVVLTCLYVALAKCAQEPNLTFGLAFANRRPGSESIIGSLVNVLPISQHIDAKLPLSALFNLLAKTMVQAVDHSDYPSLELLNGISREHEAGYHPLYQILFVAQEERALTSSTKYSLKRKLVHNKTAKFDLSFHFHHDAIARSLGIEYSDLLFDAATINRIWNLFVLVLDCSAAQDTSIAHIPFMGKEEYQQVIHGWNKTDGAYPHSKTLHQLFAEQALRTPHHCALVFEQQELTYQELDKQANQLARLLQKYQPANKLVALYLDRSFEMMIAILAVLKAGYAYVPIDPDSPIERVRFLLDDIHCALLLTRQCFIDKLPDSTETLALDTKPYQEEEIGVLELTSHPDDLAYVMYTSGTTGQPKGVLISHRGIVNRIDWMQKQFPLTSKDVVLQKTPYHFDVSVWELLWAHWTGACLVMAKPDGHKDSTYLQKLIKEQGITVLHFVPSMLSAYTQELVLFEQSIPASVRYVFSSGEALEQNQIDALYALSPKGLELHNLYGPTEASIDVTAFACTAGMKNVCIGKPIQNTRVYVLDIHQAPVAIGMLGELYLGGVGLAKGYLNQAQLTQERFVANPFATAFDKEQGYDYLYKTGDLVRWLPDGNLQYMGRNDHQIKIRGFRIEPGEIEQQLIQYSGIKHCVVLAKRKDYLAAFYLSEQPIAQEELVAHLAKHLPEYMIPSVFVHLEAFPVTANGKLNRNGLILPDFQVDAQSYLAPKTELEERLCAIWQKLLGLPKIGIRDDFFQIGGHSILAIQTIGLINLELNCQVSVKELFLARTIEQLMRYVQNSQGSFRYKDHLIAEPLALVDASAPFSLSNVQQAYLYGREANFELGNTSAHIYQEFFFHHLDVDKLERAFNVLLQRHSALRTLFNEGEQRVIEQCPYYSFKRNSDYLAAQGRLSHKVYQAEQYPLFDIEISQQAGRSIMHLSIDLLLMDGRSFAIFLDEWARVYNDETVVLPPHALSFRHYMEAYQSIRQSALFEQAKKYWEAKLPSYSFETRLPLKKQASMVLNPSFLRLRTTIKAESWNRIVAQAEAYEIGPTSVLLAIYGLVLLRWSGQERICINLTLFNRLPLHQDVHSIVGDFTVLELFNFSRSSTSFAHTVLEVHQQLWDDLDHNVFDGIDFQRMVRKQLQLDSSKTIAPLVLSSMLGVKNSQTQFQGFEQVGHTITQTPQIYLDNQAHETEEGLLVIWDYVEQLFDAETIDAMHQDYCHLIAYLAEHDWNCALCDLDFVEQQQVDEPAETTARATLIELFAAGAALNPKATAIIHQERRYDYHYLNTASDSIAKYLSNDGVQKNELIAVLSEKGYQQVIATLGIMKAGAAYLPLHIDWPIGRIYEIAQQAQIKRLLVSRAQWLLIKDTDLVDDYQVEIIEDLEQSKLPSNLPSVSPDDLAYVIFTSGSTGKPKGVTIAHWGAVNTIEAVNQRFNVGVQDCVLALSELSFDLSVYDIFGVLAQGGTIVFPEQEFIQHPEHWYQLIKQHRISLWNSVPQLMQLLLDYAQDVGVVLDSFKVVLLSGDWLPLPIASQIKAHHEQTIVMSLGGATEGSIWSIWHEIKEDLTFVPYGRAMPGQKMYVLNPFGGHCPNGVTGELYIGGEGVALGYWLNKDGTEQAFITHPHLGRLYKTGDFGRWHPEGYIEFLGRQDNQVKRHGYRVELAEIAMKLKQIDGIDDALVRLHDNRLIAYVMSKQLQPRLLEQSYLIDEDFVAQVQQELSQYLPHYMLPDSYLGLSKQSLTSNGKLDYNALPIPELSSNQPLYVAPSTELEVQIAAIWMGVLGVQAISINDNFFNIGGDSLSSIQVASKLRYAAIDCRVKDLFEHRTIEQLALYLSGKMSPVRLDSEQGILTGSFALAPLQQWFLTHCFDSSYDWNQSYLIKVPSLSLVRLQDAVRQLAGHHDLLRARFTLNEQRYDVSLDAITVAQTNIFTLPNQDPRAVLDSWKQAFDWENDLLWRLDYLDGYADGSARLLLTLHPIIADPVSVRILLTDLQRLYQGHLLGRKGTSYRQWQQSMYDYASQHPDALDFWMQQDRQEPYLTPTQDCVQHESFQLDSVLTEQLIQQANQAYHTEINDLLLTALAYALHTCTGQQAHSITVMGHGRESINERMDVSETVGLFTSMSPVHCILQDSLQNSLLHMKEYLRSIPYKGATYGVVAGDLELPAIHFGYLGQFAQQNEEWYWLTDDLSSQVHPAHASYVLALHCWVADNILYVDLGSRVDTSYNQRLIAAFKSALIDVIQHCMQQVNRDSFHYTRSDFKAVKTEADLKALPLYHDRAGQGQSFPMSEIQKAYTLGRLGQFEIGNVANHFYREFIFTELDERRLERALNRLIAHYSEMRLVFDQYNLSQRYLAFEQNTYYRIETQTFNRVYAEGALFAIRERFSHYVYDIASYPLFNLRLSRFTDRVVLHFSFDMILFDLKTVTQFYGLLTALYQDEELLLPKKSVSFRDYQCYMDLLKSSQWYANDQAYWREKINTMPLRPKLWLACDPRSLEQPQFKMDYQSVEGTVWQQFKRQAERYGLSYGSVLLALYGHVLSHCASSADFLITLTLLNRYGIHPDVDSLWGDFTSVNLFAFSAKVGSALDVLKPTHESLWNDMAHALYSGLNVQRDLMVLHRLDPSLAVSPIVFTCVLDDSASGIGALPYFINPTERADERYLIGQTSQAWIDLQVTEQDGCLYSHWLYVSQLFPEHFIAELNAHYCSLIRYLAEHDWDSSLPVMSLTETIESKAEQEHLALLKEHLLTLSGVNDVLLREQNDYLLAYLFEPALPLMMDEQKMEAFKLSEKGLRQDLQDSYTFNLTLDETEYRRCKSYRRFKAEALSEQRVPQLMPFALNRAGACPDVEELGLILSPLSALRLKDKMLAKYKYPSAGHSYSVQTYVHVPEALGDLSRGFYYYQPLTQTLQVIPNVEISQDLSLEFRVYRAAIDPLYIEEWFRFACIELGHMMYLLREVLQAQNLAYEFSWIDSANSDFYSLARLSFAANNSRVFSEELSVHLLHKTAEIFSDGTRVVDLNKYSLLMRTSAVGQVLELAQALLFFEGSADKNSWLQAGFQAQYLTSHWQQQKLGSCSLAFKPSNDTVYALALGMISAEEELLAESNSPAAVDLDKQLTMALSQSLSEGRLPDAYFILNQPPLIDGVIDWNALPVPDFNLDRQEYLAPETKLELQFCEVWQEVLGLEKIGIRDDFFRLGGDSIRCMQVTAKLRQLGIDCSVKAIFEHRCIESLLPHIQTLLVEEPNEGAEHFAYADISPELMEFLQQSYE